MAIWDGIFHFLTSGSGKNPMEEWRFSMGMTIMAGKSWLRDIFDILPRLVDEFGEYTNQ